MTRREILLWLEIFDIAFLASVVLILWAVLG
ncbi:MAG: hypothetical protein UY89_C0028G0007 [Parcubacteria group bacterium GW2011_GWA1_54_9]|nr:MAG: hypothetical protein UY89_C0028G0007 [Parcubacteria group bacterium GW2011_GWA1_54_9]